ncbi:hypothetical protein [Sinorhizobium meliloti]|uniref:hypothetical protein n=1 Tax=Rhizobium meliloti TaxID=382 RepID=UPI001F2EEF87|nr:hypothetical protein [Sinorhizobium meliloti]
MAIGTAHLWRTGKGIDYHFRRSQSDKGPECSLERGSMRGLKSIAILKAIAVVTTATVSWGQEPGRKPEVPIVIEADPGFDACGATGVVEGLNPSGDGFLAVRGGPGSNHAEIDRLYNGEQVYFCKENGEWLGVVYSKRRQDCNVSTPWISTQSYTGPCKSGWVHRNWVRLHAG